MQPYFFPYAGYFRLFCDVDQFVILDDVQFRKGGRIHRTQIPGPRGEIEWLTLPLQRHAITTRIDDVAFASNARKILDARLRRLPWLASAQGPIAAEIRDYLGGPLGQFVDFLERGLRLVTRMLALETDIIRSSSLDIPPGPGQARVLAILKHLGATHYVNAPGGRDLYAPQDFADAGIELSFLRPYQGPYTHLLHALVTQPVDDIQRDIIAQS